MFEHRSEPLLSRPAYLRRQIATLAIGAFLIVVVLSVGIAGYLVLERMTLPESFENAAMILSGMGPVREMQTNRGKVFAGFYALFSGVFFLGVAGIIFAPAVHRFLHILHLEQTGPAESPGSELNAASSAASSPELP